MKQTFFNLVLLFIACILTPITHAANESVTTPHVIAKLISEQQSIEAGQSFRVAIYFSIIDGWHTYWKNPGDSGEPPKINWQLPAGFSAGEIIWPYPHRLPVGPLMNYGYSKEAWLLVNMRAPEKLDRKQINLNAKVDWLVCEEECIPESGEFSLSLPVVDKGNSTVSEHAVAFEKVLAQIPARSNWQSHFTFSQNQIELDINLEASALSQLSDVYFYPEEYGMINHAAEQLFELNDDGLSIKLVRGDLVKDTLNQLNGVLVLSDRSTNGGVSQAYSIIATQTSSWEHQSVFYILVLALLGGLILNIMPCVFPILSLKAFSILQTAHESPARVRWNGIVFTAGVLFSFVIIAAVLLMLRASGEAIGWGFQLQSPIFILLLTWLIFIMGLQFSGVWSFGESFMGRGQRLTAMPSSAGTFFTGVLAVIVATPCTAPFMGTALGYALTQSTAIALLIFISLGLGMALPWLLISLWPALCRYLPRPGQWMNTAKQFMAFPLYATVAWLLWVLAQQVDGQSLLYALFSLVIIAMLLWLKQLTAYSQTVGKWLINSVVLLTIVGLTVFITQLKTDTDSSPQQQTTWQVYTPETLQQYRSQRTPVLVNFTAAWCITCLVNEKLVLGTADIQAELKQQGVVYMKGDWTNRNPEITRVLEQHGRSGVPLYLLFPADPQAQAMVLPNILTRSIVEEYLARLSTN